MEDKGEKNIKCENCKQEIAESKITLHQAFCLRNNKYCNKCQKTVLLSEYEEHIKSHEEKKIEIKKKENDIEKKTYNSIIQNNSIKNQSNNIKKEIKSNNTNTQNINAQKKTNLVAIGSNASDFLPLGNYDNFKKIISVDLQKFAPIENVDIIIGDITNKDIILDIISKTNNQLIDLVICDGAPDITGFNEFDVYIQSQLVLNALNTSIRILKIGGNFITKLFKGKYTDKIIQIFLTCFNKVIITKPKACRNASFESFIFCQGFKEDNNIIQQLRKKELSEDDIIILNKLKIVNDNEEFNYEKFNVDFIQVGNDEYDSDKTYDLESTNYQKILNPVQMPINPPYKYYVENLKGKNVKE